MNPIEEAMEQGYDENQILSFLTQKYPHLQKKISTALNSGHSVRNILNFFTPFLSDNKKRPTKGTSQQAINAEKRRQDIEANERLVKTGLQTAATAGGTYLAGRALQSVPKIAQQIGGAISGRGVPKAPGQAAANPLAEAVAEVAPTIPESTSQIPSLAKGQKEILDKTLKELDLSNKIKMLSKNSTPGAIVGVLDKYVPQETRKLIQDKVGIPWNEAIKIHAQDFINEESNLSISSIAKQFEEGQKLNEQAKTEQSKPALQSQQAPQERLALLPDGQVGNIVEERQGIGSVELPNGQIRRRKLSEMDAEPPELAKQINDVIESLPEEEKSRVLAFASYNPGQEFEFEGKKHNIPFMGVQFHNGDFYMYPGVSKDKFDKVVSKAVRAKTSGQNEWGVWTKGDPSRGAGMHELIKELEAEFGKNFIKFKASEGYDFWKRFRKALKEYFLRNKGK